MGAAARLRRPSARRQPAVLLEKSLAETAHGARRRRARATSDSSRRSSTTHTVSSKTSSGRCACPSTRSACCASGCVACGRRSGLARARFEGERARALFAGCAAHSVLPLERSLTAAVGLVFLLTAHVEAWPVAEGGSARDRARARRPAAVARRPRGDRSRRSRTFAELPRARAYLFDTSPGAARAHRRPTCCPLGYVRRLGGTATGRASSRSTGRSTAPSRGRSGRPPGGDGARRWDAGRDGRVRGRRVARRAPRAARSSARPAEPVRPDTRARRQAHRLRVLPRPRGLDGRPDRRDRAAGRALRARLPRSNPRAPRDERGRTSSATTPSFVGGAITGGVSDLGQLFFRPVARWNPYTTPDPRIFLCSSSTPPGGGVHGMCGFFAAQTALRALRV